MILFIEKIAFDSHSLIAHGHGDEEEEHAHGVGYQKIDGHNHVRDNLHIDEDHAHDHSHGKQDHSHNNIRENFVEVHNNPLYEKNKYLKEPLINKDHINYKYQINKKRDSHDNLRHKDIEEELFLNYEEVIKEKSNSERQDTDEDEQAIKNVVSAKGKFATLLQIRNIMQSPNPKNKPNKAMLLAGQILSGSNKEDNLPIQHNECLRKISFQEELVEMENAHHHHFSQTSNLTPYILLVALSFHGLFEGIALGIQDNIRDTIFLSIAITSHKWAEAITLGISFSKAGTETKTFIKLIFMFSVFTPIGVLLGIGFTSSSSAIEGVFLALSTGKLVLLIRNIFVC